MTLQQRIMMGLFGAIGLVFGLTGFMFMPWPTQLLENMGWLLQVLFVVGITALFTTVGAWIGAPPDNNSDSR